MTELFLNTAAIGKISPATASAMSDAVVALSTGAPDIRGWVIAMEKCRREASKLFGAENETGIGFLQNTSQAISAVAEGLQWEPGDEVIVPSVEYPANQYPWLNLERRGVVVISAEPNADGGVEWDDLKKYMSDKTKLVAFSHVQFRQGYRCDVQRIAKECRERGILTLVDVIQSAGVFELSQKEWGVDFMVAGSQKWLKGPPGIGILSVRPELLNQLTPVMTGAFSVKNPFDVSTISLDFQEDGHRFESGTMNFLGFVGLQQALKEVTTETQERTLSKCTLMRESVQSIGFSVLGSGNSEKQSGIITFTNSTIDMENLFEKLTAEGVVATCRENSIRIAPDWSTTETEITRFKEILLRSM